MATFTVKLKCDSQGGPGKGPKEIKSAVNEFLGSVIPLQPAMSAISALPITGTPPFTKVFFSSQEAADNFTLQISSRGFNLFGAKVSVPNAAANSATTSVMYTPQIGSKTPSSAGSVTPLESRLMDMDMNNEKDEQSMMRLDGPDDCVVVLIGVAVVGTVAEAALKLDLEYTFHVVPLKILVLQRQVQFSVPTPADARNAVRNLHGNEILGQVVTAFIRSSKFNLLGGTVPQPTSAAFVGMPDIAEQFSNWQRYVSEAQYVHNMETSKVLTQKNEIPLMYRSSVRVCATNNKLWLSGIFPHTNITVAWISCGSENSVLPAGDKVLLQDVNGDPSPLTDSVTDIYEEVSQEKDGVVLKWRSGLQLPAAPFVLLRKTGKCFSIGPSVNGPWSRSMLPEHQGSFTQPVLSEWRCRETPQTIFKKSTWRWWVEASNPDEVREIFETIERNENSVIVRDM